MAFVLEAPLLF